MEKMIAVSVMLYNGFTLIVLVLGLLISPIRHRFVVAPKEEHTRMNEWTLCAEAVRSGGRQTVKIFVKRR